MDEIDPKTIQQSQQDGALKDRLRQADLVVSGTVTAVRPFEQRRLPDTEHLPDQKLAVVKVERVLKGELQGDVVEFIFAGSRDVHWFRAPKFQGEETGVFFLTRGSSQAESLKISAQRFTLFDPRDFQPRERAEAIEALTR